MFQGILDTGLSAEPKCPSRGEESNTGLFYYRWLFPNTLVIFIVLKVGESCGQRSMEGYSPSGLKESDTTETT